MAAQIPAGLMPRSLVLATDLDVLPLDRVVERRDGHWVFRSPSNPRHYWGNLLLFDDPPAAGDRVRWERLFEAEFAEDPRVAHRAFAWDRADGALGCAREEFVEHDYELDDSIGLIATAEQVRAHPRANAEVLVRTLDPAAGADERLWDGVVELQVAGRDERLAEAQYRRFSRTRLEDLRVLCRAGRGFWYVARYPGGHEVVASCGVVATRARGRFQAVDTAVAHRRRGICSRLIVEAARHCAELRGTERFVIVADAGYHALGLYESLGFERKEHVYGACRWPRNNCPTHPPEGFSLRRGPTAPGACA